MLLCSLALLLWLPCRALSQVDDTGVANVDCGQVSGGYYLASQANINQISSCQTIYGDIQIVPAPNDGTLGTINLPTTMATITGSLEYLGFYDQSDATSAINAQGLTSIGSINAAATIIYDGNFDNYTLPWGRGSNPGLLIYNFPSLKSMSFPALTSIGGDFLFAQNSAVTSITGFQNLGKIGGSLNITGNFDTVDLPKLTSVGGSVYIQSSSPKFQCPSSLLSLGVGPAHCSGTGNANSAPSSTPTPTPSSNSSLLPSERYELCTSSEEISALQQKYGLIQVTATPTHAAIHPSWPGSLLSIAVGLYALVVALNERNLKTTAEAGSATIAIPLIIIVRWIISFATIEHEKATGGWVSATEASVTANFTAWAREAGFGGLYGFLLLVWTFQGAGTSALWIQRWMGTVGSVAYLITNTNGCTPANGLGFLQQGARSRAFRIIQTTEAIFASFALSSTSLSMMQEGHPGKHKATRATLATILMFIYVPVLIYECIIAVKGRPVVISGNCMLVELDPKFGFYDSEIDTWWKILISLGGM